MIARVHLRRGRAPALLPVAFVALFASFAARADDVAARITAAQDALADWQLDEAARIAAELERDLPDVPPVQAVVGLVRFHQGEYDAALKLLRRAAESGGEMPQLLALVESTAKETAGFVSAESEHFIVRTPPGKDELLQPIALWALEEAYRELTKAFDYAPKHKIVVDILHDAKGLASVSTLTVKEIETSGTIALCKFNRLMITSPKALARGYSWLDTLSHELVHLVVSEKSKNNVPVWLHEGLAKYNESRWRGAPGLALDPASENLLATSFKKNKLITFEQMHPSMAKLPSQEDAALAFAEVFTVVEWLEKERELKDKRKAANVIIEGLRDGLDMDKALTKAIGVDLAGLQKDWRKYLARRAFRIVPGAEPQKLTFIKGARSGGAGVEEQEDEAALDEARSKAGRQWVRLGNLLREKRRLKAASIEYEKAVKQIGVRAPALHNRLAGVYIEMGALDDAKRVLGDIVTVFPDDPQTHVLLGRVAFRAKDWAAARKHYERATWEAPFNPEIHVALLKIGEATNDAALSKKAMRAVELLAGAAKSSSDVPAHAREGEPYGILEVRSTPWGRVLLDGVDVGTTTPLIDYKVKPGMHRVRVIDPVTGTEQGEAVTITEGQVARVELTLEELSPERRKALVDAEEALKPAPPPPKKPTAPKESAPVDDKPLAPWETDDDEPMSLPPERDRGPIER
jgi:tetratricopeptide (TPR) repeat protein